MAACPKCGGAMLTERPGDHRCPSAASQVISVISPSEEPPIVNVRVEFPFEEGKGPTAKLWVTGRPIEAADWEAVKKAIDSVISVHDAEFFTPKSDGPRVPRGGILG